MFKILKYNNKYNNNENNAIINRVDYLNNYLQANTYVFLGLDS